jgi:hypothetical protein
LPETFANLDRYSIKLNPKKCSFGVPTGQLLGYLISERGIEGTQKIFERSSTCSHHKRFDMSSSCPNA